MIELRVVEAIEKMNRAGTRRCHADADLTGELRMRAGHERGHLLMTYLDEVDLSVGAIERAEHAVDPVAGIAVNAFDAPISETFDQKLARRISHCSSSPA